MDWGYIGTNQRPSIVFMIRIHEHMDGLLQTERCKSVNQQTNEKIEFHFISGIFSSKSAYLIWRGGGGSKVYQHQGFLSVEPSGSFHFSKRNSVFGLPQLGIDCIIFR